MIKYPYLALFIFVSCGTTISICSPNFFAGNSFVDKFVADQYINFMAVVVTVSLVSVVQLNLEFTKIERRFKVRAFVKSRNSVNRNGGILIFLLVFSFIASIIKGISALGDFPKVESVLHVLVLASVIECVWIMYELVKTANIVASNEPLENDL